MSKNFNRASLIKAQTSKEYLDEEGHFKYLAKLRRK